MSGRRPETVHTQRKQKATHEALQQYVRDLRRRQREQRRAARQQQEQAQ